jgi:hypothetical protein
MKRRQTLKKSKKIQRKFHISPTDLYVTLFKFLQCCAIIPCSSSTYDEAIGSVVKEEINIGDDDG